MTPVTRNQKIYFAAVGALALWVFAWGFFVPEHVDKAIPWLIPPLHARFVGALYFAAVVFIGGSILARRYEEVRVSTIIVAIWTGALFVISLFYLGEFNFGRGPVWFWFGAYIAYPLIGFWYVWAYRGETGDESTSPDLPAWIRRAFLIQGVILTGLALALFFAPELMLTVWPWKVTRMLIQIYSGPFLSFGVGSLWLSRQRNWSAIRIVVAGFFVLALGVLIASLIHRSLFSPANSSTWVWFTGFALVFVFQGVVIFFNRTKPGAAS
jgi:hypothetical protein